ncbi:MAG: hypothetical protein AAGJ46_12795 [Planctomycetota bacterium]
MANHSPDEPIALWRVLFAAASPRGDSPPDELVEKAMLAAQGVLDDSQQERLLALLSDSPGRVATYLDLVRQGSPQTGFDANSLATELQRRVLGSPPLAEFGLEVSSGPQGLTATARTARVAPDYAQTRAAGEPVTSIETTHNLRGCELVVTVEQRPGGEFAVLVRLAFSEPEPGGQGLFVVLGSCRSDHDGASYYDKQPIDTATAAEFDSIPSGEYLVEVLAGTKLRDAFRMRISDQTIAG